MPSRRLPPLAGVLLAGVLSALGGCDCQGETLGRSLPPGARLETFQQAEVSKMDVLWVVDNSRSMIEEQQNLAENLLSFFRFLDEGDVDYQIAVTTTDAVSDAGRFVGYPEVLTPLTSSVLEAFQGNLQVGTAGRAQEQGLAAALMALQEQNPDFLREDAHLFVIFVSDEDDHSFGELRYFWRVFEQLKGIGNDAMVSASAIIGPPSDPETGAAGGCESDNGLAAPGDRYAALARETGGLFGSICDPSFADTLNDLGAAAVGLKRKFFLTGPADPDGIEIRILYPCEGRPEQLGACESVEDTCGQDDGAYVCIPPRGEPDGWVYEEGTSSIFFAGDSVPGLKAVVEVVYLPPPVRVTE